MPKKFDPPTDRDRRIVQGLCILGMNQEGIAELLDCSVETLIKYFPDEMANGPMQSTASVAGMLYQQCEAGNVTAQIFWLKCRGRWRERDEPLPPPPPGDRADVGDGGAAAETELPINPNAPRLGGLNLIGPTKRKPVTQIEAAPVKPAGKKTNGHAK